MKKIIILCIFFATCLTSYFSYQIFAPFYQGENYYFSVKSGERFSNINYRLHKSGLISTPFLFHRYTWIKGALKKIQSGVYLIPNGASIHDIFDILTNGKAMTTSVTIPEGKNIYEIGQLLEQSGIVSYKEFIQVAKDKLFLKELGLDYLSVEGYLFPETYSLTKGLSGKEIIRIMVDEFRKKTDLNEKSHSYLNTHEIIILASIVEKETGARFERRIIAGVFHNRLKKGIRLQSDPTTIYGIFENFSGNLRKKDLLTKTPYNTYKINGLPIGPISNPGLESIKAVLNPEKHNYLYFVSKNDGTHLFTKNYKDHQKGVQFFQKSKKNRKGKSWRDLKQ